MIPEDIYEDSKDYNNDSDYNIFNNSGNSDDESYNSIVSQSFNNYEKSNIGNSSLDTSEHMKEKQLVMIQILLCLNLKRKG